jgi:hypothetical protein
MKVFPRDTVDDECRSLPTITPNAYQDVSTWGVGLRASDVSNADIVGHKTFGIALFSKLKSSEMVTF